MASGYAPMWRRLLHKTPLFKRGPYCGNYHWRTDRFCHCCVGEHFGDWHGGVYDFSLRKEVPNAELRPPAGPFPPVAP